MYRTKLLVCLLFVSHFSIAMNENDNTSFSLLGEKRPNYLEKENENEDQKQLKRQKIDQTPKTEEIPEKVSVQFRLNTEKSNGQIMICYDETTTCILASELPDSEEDKVPDNSYYLTGFQGNFPPDLNKLKNLELINLESSFMKDEIVDLRDLKQLQIAILNSECGNSIDELILDGSRLTDLWLPNQLKKLKILSSSDLDTKLTIDAISCDSPLTDLYVTPAFNYKIDDHDMLEFVRIDGEVFKSDEDWKRIDIRSGWIHITNVLQSSYLKNLGFETDDILIHYGFAEEEYKYEPRNIWFKSELLNDEEFEKSSLQKNWSSLTRQFIIVQKYRFTCKNADQLFKVSSPNSIPEEYRMNNEKLIDVLTNTSIELAYERFGKNIKSARSVILKNADSEDKND